MGDGGLEGILVTTADPDTTAGADILKSVKPIFDNSYQISKQAFILIWRIMPYRLSISGLKNLGVGSRGLSTGLIVPATPIGINCKPATTNASLE